MKSIEELRALYENELKDKLRLLEKKRLKVRNKFIILIAVVIVAVACFIFASEQQGLSFLNYIGVLAIIGLIVLFVIANKAKGEYRKAFKENVVRAIVNLINTEWSYNPDGCISSEEYTRSKLFTKRYDRYKGDDLVTGAIDKTDFRISELHTEYKTETRDSKGNTKTTWHTIFKGLFAHLDFNKEIKGETLVLPDTAERLFGNFGKKLQSWTSGSRELIKMENREFEKLFVVYGTDQIEARYILTPAMMEAMIRIVEVYGKQVFFSFIGNRVFFAISIREDLFEPRIFSSGVKFEDIEKMNRHFGIIETLIQELNLNTRIWTKE